jgi:hypothetical protein
LEILRSSLPMGHVQKSCWMTNSWNEHNTCFNAGEVINHAVRTKLRQKAYKVIKLKQLASWAGISPTKLLLLRILCNKATDQ